MKCPKCGYEDPFHQSWFVPWKEVAEPCWVDEWDPALLDLLQDGDVVDATGHEPYVYHLTRNGTTVERMTLMESIMHSLYGTPPQERAHRKNIRLAGQKALKVMRNARK